MENGIETAIENDYIAEPNEDYLSSNSTLENDANTVVLDNMKTNIKIDEFLMTNLNLSVNFNIELDKKISTFVDTKNLKNIELKDLIVTDDENRIIYTMTTKERFDEFCKLHNLPYVYGENNENYINCGVNTFIKEQNTETNQIILTYNIYGEELPKSKKLYFDFTKILLKEIKDDSIEKNTIITGDWKINVDVPEKMYNRETNSYKVVSCSNKDFHITNAEATDTGFEIGIIIDNMKRPKSETNWMFWLDRKLKEELKEGVISEDEVETRKYEILLSTEFKEIYEQWNPIKDDKQKFGIKYNIEDISFVENENGEKFVKSMSARRKQDNNFIDGNKFSYYETYELTKYDCTDKLKFQIIFKGSPVIIELEKLY